MKIKKVCEKTGLTDKAIRFYIRSGLVFPKYNENYTGRKSYNFSEEDITRLNQIATLRKYNFSIENIKEIFEDETKIKIIVENRIKKISSEIIDLASQKKDLIKVKEIDPKDVEQLCNILNKDSQMDKAKVPDIDSQAPYKLLYKKNRKVLFFIMTVLIVLGISICILALTLLSSKNLERFFGISDECVISENFLEIDYKDTIYKNLDTEGYMAAEGDILVNEAKTHEHPIMKFFFSEVVYSVDNVKDNELIYLQTDYDYIPSKYYCIESKYVDYIEMIKNFKEEEYYLMKHFANEEYIINLEEEFIGELLQLNKLSNETADCSRLNGDNWLVLISYEENKIFYKEKGEIIYKTEKEKYYYYPYDSETEYVYEIEEKYYPMLDKTFIKIGD